MIKKPELMAPAGDRTMLTAVVENGADAVYFGIEKLNMRAKASNFTLENLSDVVEYCHERNVKTYLTLNTIIKEDEIAELDDLIIKVKAAKVDMIICWDFSVINKCREHNMPFCVSTQASMSNSAAVNMLAALGAQRVVPARECSLEELLSMKKNCNIEFEVFIHGAMCVAVSGRCFLSHDMFNKSANRGECVQPCRRLYEVTDTTTGQKLKVGDDYIFSAKDLCTLPFLDKLIEAGLDSFKIEGRKRSPEYAAKVTSVYRRAIDDYFDGKFTIERKIELLDELREVYNRGFSDGFYLDVPDGNDFINISGSAATTVKEYTAKIIGFYPRPSIAYAKVESGSFSVGDKLIIIGPTSGVVEVNLEEMMVDDVKVETVQRGDQVTFKVPSMVRNNDKVYIIKTKEAVK